MQVSGTGAGLPLARKPHVVWAAGFRAPFQLAFRAVTVVPLGVRSAPQAWVIRWPSGRVNRTIQPPIGAVPVLVTLTSPWKPPGHCPTVR